MKKYIAGFIIGVFATVGITAFADEVTSLIASRATFDVYVSGEKLQSDKPIAVIDGSTYLPLKDTGKALNVDVSWNEKDRRVEVGTMGEKQMASPAGVELEPATFKTASPVSLEPTESIIVTAAPQKNSTPTPNIADDKFGSYPNTKYYFKSEICTPDQLRKHELITYQGEQYVPASLIGSGVVTEKGNYYAQLPGREPVLVKTDRGATENSYIHSGMLYIKLSSVGLKARIEGDTAYIEWAD